LPPYSYPDEAAPQYPEPFGSRPVRRGTAMILNVSCAPARATRTCSRAGQLAGACSCPGSFAGSRGAGARGAASWGLFLSGVVCRSPGRRAGARRSWACSCPGVVFAGAGRRAGAPLLGLFLSAVVVLPGPGCRSGGLSPGRARETWPPGGPHRVGPASARGGAVGWRSALVAVLGGVGRGGRGRWGVFSSNGPAHVPDDPRPSSGPMCDGRSLSSRWAPSNCRREVDRQERWPGPRHVIYAVYEDSRRVAPTTGQDNPRSCSLSGGNLSGTSPGRLHLQFHQPVQGRCADKARGSLRRGKRAVAVSARQASVPGQRGPVYLGGQRHLRCGSPHPR